MTVWEAVIKINQADEKEHRARDISEGIGYACALLMDEYGWSAEAVEDRLGRAVDEAYDQQEQR